MSSSLQRGTDHHREGHLQGHCYTFSHSSQNGLEKPIPAAVAEGWDWQKGRRDFSTWILFFIALIVVVVYFNFLQKQYWFLKLKWLKYTFSLKRWFCNATNYWPSSVELTCSLWMCKLLPFYLQVKAPTPRALIYLIHFCWLVGTHHITMGNRQRGQSNTGHRGNKMLFSELLLFSIIKKKF